MSTLRNYTPPADFLTGRVILVTGATRGIGRSISRALICHGANVVLHGRNTDALNVLSEECRNLGPRPKLETLDLENTDESGYQKLSERVFLEYGRLDGLLHNASILGARETIENYDSSEWQKVIQVNLNSAFMLTKNLLPLLRRSPDASMIFTTSGVGNRGRSNWGAYCVSKFGIEGLAQTLADELKNTSIRVNYLDPGATRTEMRHAAYPDEDPKTLPLPEDILGSYLYLLGPESKGINGKRVIA